MRPMTILRPLPNSLLFVGNATATYHDMIAETPTGPVYGPGFRVGDIDVMSHSSTNTMRNRKSKDQRSRITSFEEVAETEFRVSLTAMQHSDDLRAAQMLSETGRKTQVASSGITTSFGNLKKGVYKLADFGLQSFDLASESIPLVIGADYLVDLPSGQFELNSDFEDVDTTHALKGIDSMFFAGIGSRTNRRGMLVSRGLSENGIQPLIVYRNWNLSPTGSREIITSSNEYTGMQFDGIAAPVSGSAIQPGTEIGYETDVPEDF